MRWAALGGVALCCVADEDVKSVSKCGLSVRPPPNSTATRLGKIRLAKLAMRYLAYGGQSAVAYAQLRSSTLGW